ncbi:MAG: SCO1664 family protein [Propionicimonas sp.]|uniref:SCO1664 family protein n=1 Tax=Propionicimonas sp. TaxID=1955623 RepID=UPI003D0CB2B0
MSALPRPEPTADDRVLDLLARGRMEIIGRFPSSNLTLLVEVGDREDAVGAVYKPEAGERPLWDFDPGLHRRERAAWLLSEWLGWGLVPPTIVREDGPLGVGSVQLYIDVDERENFFTLDQSEAGVVDALRAMAVFDLVANNADRKGGHVLHGPDGRLWGIDHGLCFAAPFKLRTVIWDFADEPIPEPLLERVAPLAENVPAELCALIDPDEVDALKARVRRVVRFGRFPVDHSGRRVPWPMV